MRTLGLGVVAAGLLLASAARAQDEQKAVRDILDKAVQAIGGADKAAKLADVKFKGKATLSEGGMDLTFTLDGTAQGYDRVHMKLSATVMGMSKNATMVINGEKAWARDSDQNKSEDAPKEIVHLLQAFVLAIRSTGHPGALAAQKDFTLAPGGEAKVNDATATILRLSRKDKPELTLYYDKKTGLPLKVETRLKEQDGADEKSYEFHFSEFKDMGGVKHFGRVKFVRDGKDLTEVEFTEFKVGEKPEASTFEKP